MPLPTYTPLNLGSLYAEIQQATRRYLTIIGG